MIVDQSVWKGFDTKNDAFRTTTIQIVLPFGLSSVIPFLPFFPPFILSFLGLGKAEFYVVVFVVVFLVLRAFRGIRLSYYLGERLRGSSGLLLLLPLLSD